jgi:hypothetical protein
MLQFPVNVVTVWQCTQRSYRFLTLSQIQQQDDDAYNRASTEESHHPNHNNKLKLRLGHPVGLYWPFQQCEVFNLDTTHPPVHIAIRIEYLTGREPASKLQVQKSSNSEPSTTVSWLTFLNSCIYHDRGMVISSASKGSMCSSKGVHSQFHRSQKPSSIWKDETDSSMQNIGFQAMISSVNTKKGRFLRKLQRVMLLSYHKEVFLPAT